MLILAYSGGTMPEILTESFCERCGTRYTFESAAPRKTRRLGQFKTLSKGMKNWVMSDDTSLDEAMAAARNDDDRELTTQQLDAFHSTFNFCMTCRQYTCGNCWNAAEGRCLTCAPHLGHEILPAPFPEQVAFEPARIEAEAWPEIDLSLPGAAAANGNGHLNGAHGDDVDPWAATGAPGIDDIPEIDPAARLAFLSGETPLPVVEPETPWPAAVDASAWPAVDERIGDTPAAIAGATVSDAEPAAAEAVGSEMTDVLGGGPDVVVAPESLGVEPSFNADETTAATPTAAPSEEPAPVVAATAARPPVEPLPASVEGKAGVGAARTADLLRRFRPGQNIDAELAAYEATLAPPIVSASAAESVVEPAAAEPELEQAAAEVVAAEPEPAEPTSAARIPNLTWPTPAAPAAPIAADAPREDRIEQPTWQIYAPDASPAAAQPITEAIPPVAPVQATPAATSDPQWPVRPDQTDSPAMALLANRANRSPSEALWAASAQEVLARPASAAASAPVAGVQPCSSCGLSLSATARFCRRCGTRQG